MYNQALKSPIVDQSLGNIIDKRINSLKDEMKEFKTVTTERFETCEMKQDGFDQTNRSKTLRISNVKDTANEDTEQAVIELGSAMGLILDPDDLERAFRVGKFTDGENRQILVEFYRLKTCKLFFTSKGNLKSKEMKKKKSPYLSVYINEDLTRLRAKMCYDARQLVANGFLYSAWANWGEVYVKPLSDSKAIRLTSKDQVSTLKLDQPLPPDQREQAKRRKNAEARAQPAGSNDEDASEAEDMDEENEGTTDKEEDADD